MCSLKDIEPNGEVKPFSIKVQNSDSFDTHFLVGVAIESTSKKDKVQKQA